MWDRFGDYVDNDDDDDDDDDDEQYNVFQNKHQVTVVQRQRSDLEQRSDMRQQHASQLHRSDVGHQLKVC